MSPVGDIIGTRAMEHVRTLRYVGVLVPRYALFGVDLVDFVKIYDNSAENVTICEL